MSAGGDLSGLDVGGHRASGMQVFNLGSGQRRRSSGLACLTDASGTYFGDFSFFADLKQRLQFLSHLFRNQWTYYLIMEFLKIIYIAGPQGKHDIPRHQSALYP